MERVTDALDPRCWHISVIPSSRQLWCFVVSSAAGDTPRSLL